VSEWQVGERVWVDGGGGRRWKKVIEAGKQTRDCANRVRQAEMG